MEIYFARWTLERALCSEYFVESRVFFFIYFRKSINIRSLMSV